MGATHVTVRNYEPRGAGQVLGGAFLVDTGATDSLAPRPHLEAIGLKPEGKRVYELADGSEITADVAVPRLSSWASSSAGRSSLARLTQSRFWA